MASTDLTWENEEQAKGAIADVRSNNSPTNWVLFTYSESKKNTLELVGTGTGDVEELKTHLDETKIFYGLLRTQDIIDQSVTIKFVFIIWCGEKVAFIQKAKMTTHKGSITVLIGQYHTDLNCSNLNEINQDIVTGKVRDASGTAIHVKENVSKPASSAPAPAAATAVASAPKPTVPASPKSAAKPAVPQQASIVQFEDEEGIRKVIAQVRADNDETDWMLVGYETNTKLKLIGSGSNGMDELLTYLKDDQIAYGLYRTTDTVDNTVAIKFVLIIWVGEKVPIARKARITTHKGEVTTFFGQYHVDLNCSNLEEISEDIVRELVQKASGTRNYVK